MKGSVEMKRILKEANYEEPDDIEYSVENADWTETYDDDDWEDALERLSKLLTPEEYRKLKLTCDRNVGLISTILYDVLEGYEPTPLALKWVIDNAVPYTEDILYIPGVGAEETFIVGNFSERDFPEYFDYESWFEDFKNGDLSDNNGYELYTKPNGFGYAINTKSFISKLDRFLAANG